MSVLVPVSLGEIADKISVLIVKSSKMSDDAALENVKNEKAILESICKEQDIDFGDYLIQLVKINCELWDILQEQRDATADQEFIKLSIEVYEKNDERFSIKQKINQIFHSEIIEEKHYD